MICPSLSSGVARRTALLGDFIPSVNCKNYCRKSAQTAQKKAQAHRVKYRSYTGTRKRAAPERKDRPLFARGRDPDVERRLLGVERAELRYKVSANFRSFSVVSAPIFARKYAFCSILKNLADYLAEFFAIWQILQVLQRLQKCC